MRIHLRRVVLWLLGTSLMSFVLVVHIQQENVQTQLNHLPQELPTASDTPNIDEHILHATLKVTLMETPNPKILANLKSLKEKKLKLEKLFPYRDEVYDRVLDQLNLTLPVQKNKTILVWNGLENGMKGNRRFLSDKCPMTNCYVTAIHNEARTADAILFKNSIPSTFQRIHQTINNTDQVRILYMLESPFHSSMQSYMGSLINWTATYRRDSVLNTPYERFTPFANKAVPEHPAKNYAAGKIKMAAWFVSNCDTRNGRGEYVKELQKHVQVDIYGGCGPFKCPRKNSKVCYDYLNADYKFYLAFENSNCKDYITEKLYWNALQNDVLPIVMGAHPDDYARSAPPHSYIHVDDFDSPEDLAAYLHELDKDDAAYNAYFAWKGTGEFINTKFWCRLCSMVNIAPQMPMWYEQMNTWWSGPGICTQPGIHKWSSWRKSTRNTNFMDTVKYGYARHNLL